MKITIEQDFEGWKDAHVAKWLARFSAMFGEAPPSFAHTVALGPLAQAALDATAPNIAYVPGETELGKANPEVPLNSAEPVIPAPRQRKPRADAGKPRGPHKSTDSAPVGVGSATPPPDGQPQGGSTPPAVSNSEAPVASPTATPTTASAAPAASESGKKLTIDDARAALKRISDTKGLGMEACMQHLQEFKVTRISDVKEADYALFIKQADEKVAEREAEAGGK